MRSNHAHPADYVTSFLPLGLSLLVLSCRPAERPQAAPAPVGLKGIQSGWVLDDASGADSGYQVSFDRYPTILPTITQLGAHWYRFELRVPAKAVARARRRREAQGLSPECGAQCSPADLGWDEPLLRAYDRAVDSVQARGLKVLGLISNGTVLAPQGEQLANSAELVGGNGDNRYIANLGSVVFPMLLRRFAGRIQVWEIGNEPDVWTRNNGYALTASDVDAGKLPGGSFIYPSNFAQLLSRTFYVARAAEQDGLPALTLVSGGLLSMNRADDWPAGPLRNAALFDNAAGAYLQAFVSAGFAYADWGTIVKHYRRFPVDGWGLHLYVNQDTPELARNPWGNFGRYVAAFQHMTGRLSKKYVGGRRGLPVWITELGFGTTLAAIPAADRSDSVRARYWEYEAEGLEVAYQCVAQLETGAPAFWFALFDVPNSGIESGLFTPVWGTPEFAPLTAKPAADRYRSVAAAAAPLDCRRTETGGRPRRIHCDLRQKWAGAAPGMPFAGQCRDV